MPSAGSIVAFAALSFALIVVPGPSVMFVVGFANPKSIVFFAAILPQYVGSEGAPAAVQMALLGVIFVLVALATDSVWGIAAGTARKWFADSPRRLERLGVAGAVVMIGLGVQLALLGRKD